MTVLETLYDGYGVRLLLEEAPLPDGRIKKVVRYHRADSVNVLAFHNDATVVLLREFRPLFQSWVWILPSGRADKETDIANAAHRELREEAGLRAETMEPYFSMQYTESLGFAHHAFIARGLHEDPLPPDGDEMIEVHRMSLGEAVEKVLSSTPIITPSALTLLRYEREHR